MNRHIIEDIYELSPMQLGMLFHTVYEPDSRLYFEQVVIPFDAAIDAGRISDAWASVAEANTALRTSIHWEDLDKAVQVVNRDARIKVEGWDLRQTPALLREQVFQEQLAADRDRGIDFVRAPLMRIALARMDTTSYRMVLSFHHIILDGWSLQAVFGQFSEAYARLIAGESATLKHTRPYRAFIEWLQAQNPAEAERYWAGVLADAQGLSGIAHAPAGTQSARAEDFGEIELSLPSHESEALRASGSSRKLTLNTLLQGAWAFVLARFTGNDDIVFGVTVSGRPAEIAQVEEMIGLFINTVPLRANMQYGAALADWLLALQVDQFHARSFDHCGLVQIREWADLPADQPLFDTIFAFENYPTNRADGQARADTIFIERTNFPLSVAAIPGDSLQLRLLYDARAISAETVGAIGDALLVVLRAFTEALEDKPNVTLGDLAISSYPMFGAEEADRVYPEASLPELFDEVAAAYPDAVAIEEPECHATYAELLTSANALARSLVAEKISRGKRIALLLGSTIDMATAMLAVLKLGATYVPLDSAYPRQRLAAILEETGAALILTDSTHAKQAEALHTRVFRIDQRRSTTKAVRLPAGPSIDDVAYVMFTSGSSGRPKGIEIPHRAIVRLVRDTDYISLGPGDRIAQHSNVAFDATTFEIWGPLLNGATAIMFDRETMLTPDRLSEALAKRKITTLFLTTALFNRIITERVDAFRPLKTLMFGGEAADIGAVRTLLQSDGPDRLLHVYGPTESTTFATWQLLDAIEADQLAPPIGGPIAHTTAYVLDCTLRPLPPGAPGELLLGGDGLAHGYSCQPALTAEKFVPDPFSRNPGQRLYRTGDLVRLDEKGRIVFLNRIDSQIKLRGFRIELGEIEALLLAQPAVDQAVVICRGEGDGRCILAFVTANEDVAGFEQSLMQALSAQLPGYAMPSAIAVLEALPVTRNGKIDRATLPGSIVQPQKCKMEVPKTITEERLLKIWASVLEREDFGIHDNFFDIGGHSLRATQLASRIKRELGISVTLRKIFENPTVAALAQAMEVTNLEPTATPADAEPAPQLRNGVIKAVSRNARQHKRVPSA
ncbi:MAG: amino acid adenylation domain-containing protein [Gammaproteobacteria bacterium]|nr:amino acid adenylation domain-containing protein [Gammaproteobacteria bacterium]